MVKTSAGVVILTIVLLGLLAWQRAPNVPPPPEATPPRQKEPAIAEIIRAIPSPVSPDVPSLESRHAGTYLGDNWTRRSEKSYDVEMESPLRVGGLTADGAVVPYFIFDGSRWSTHWPPPEYGQSSMNVVVPALQAIPTGWWGGHAPVHRWWLTSASSREQVTTTGTSLVERLCGVQPALVTDFVSPEPFEKTNGGAPWVGTVVSSNAGISPIEEIDERSREFAEVYGIARELFPDREAQVWGKRINSSDMRQAPKITLLRASNLPDGRRIFAFRATQQVGKIGAMVITGWIRRDRNATPDVSGVSAFQEDPDGKGEGRIYPELALTLGEHTFWIGMTYGYESRSYFVVEVGRGEPALLLDADAGGC